MEGLRKLEKVQRVISTMKDHNIASGNPENDRFIAEFFIFLAQPSGTLSMDEKRELIFEHLPRDSLRKLEEACDCVIDEECWETSEVLPPILRLDYDKEEHPLTDDDLGNLVVVGIDAMQHANSTFEDFCKSYFMFHGMDINNPNTVFKFLPMLFLTESCIYQLDSMNEKYLLLLKKNTNTNAKGSFSRLSGVPEKVGNVIKKGCSCKCSSSNIFDSLILLFQHHGLLTDRIESELKLGSEYWALERNLCDAILSKMKISIEDVLRAVHLKSFDYRVLNLLLYQLRGEKEISNKHKQFTLPRCLVVSFSGRGEASLVLKIKNQMVNDLHMEFLSVSELLVEISDDLYDYEEDVIKNSFNVLRMFVKIYGPSLAPSMLAKYIAETEEKYSRLSNTLDPDLFSKYQRRCREATAEGGVSSGHSLGTWNIPPIIAHEESYRMDILKSQQNSTNKS